MSHYDLWQTWKELAVNLRALALLEKIEKAATARYENGKTTQVDVLKAANEKLKLVETEMDLALQRETTQAELTRLLGREPGTIIEELSELPEPKFRIDLATVRSLVTSKHPALLGAMEGGVAAAQARLDLAKKSTSPDFQFRIEARQFNGQGGLTEYDTGVFLNLPWFNKRRTDSAIANAKATLDARRDDYDTMRQKEIARAQKLYVGIATYAHHHALYRDRLIPQQRAAVEASRASYESGMMGLLDLLDAQRMLLEYEMLDAHHIAETYRQAAELEVLTGGELPQLPAEKAP
jgi:outer membrane protein TolC